jgi:hypothetical protein
MNSKESHRLLNLKSRIIETNSLIIIIYLFQYGLLAPFSILLNSQLALLFSTIVLFIWAIFLNKSFNIKVWPLYVFPFLILLIKRPFEFEVENIDLSMDYILSFLTIGVTAIYFGSLNFSLNKLVYYGVFVSFINLILLGLIPFTPYYGENINYMKFGYGILPSVLFLSIYVLNSYNIKLYSIIILFLSILLLVFFGARGATLCLVFFILIYIYTGSVNKKIKISFTIFIVFSLFVFVPLLNRLVELMDYYDFSTYSIEKYFKLYFDDESTLSSTSSGRDVIYSTAFSRIVESPILGSPFNTCYVDTGVEYYHNFILDILVNFGLIFSSLFISFLGYLIIRIRKYKRKYLYEVFLIFFTLSIIRLTISSNFWQRPEFWLLLSFLVTQKSISNEPEFKIDF